MWREMTYLSWGNIPEFGWTDYKLEKNIELPVSGWKFGTATSQIAQQLAAKFDVDPKGVKILLLLFVWRVRACVRMSVGVYMGVRMSVCVCVWVCIWVCV